MIDIQGTTEALESLDQAMQRTNQAWKNLDKALVEITVNKLKFDGSSVVEGYRWVNDPGDMVTPSGQTGTYVWGIYPNSVPYDHSYEPQPQTPPPQALPNLKVLDAEALWRSLSAEQREKFLDQARSDVKEAENWPRFAELRTTIREIMERDQSLTLRAAYVIALKLASTPESAAAEPGKRLIVLDE